LDPDSNTLVLNELLVVVLVVNSFTRVTLDDVLPLEFHQELVSCGLRSSLEHTHISVCLQHLHDIELALEFFNTLIKAQMLVVDLRGLQGLLAAAPYTHEEVVA